MLKVPEPCKINVKNRTGISEFQIPFSERYQEPAGTFLSVSNYDIISSVPTRVSWHLHALCVSAYTGISFAMGAG